TPNANINGDDSFSYIANDGSSDSNAATVIISITPVNDPPIAQSDELSTIENQSQTGILHATDIDSMTLTYRIDSHPNKGTVNIINDLTGEYTYIPDTNIFGEDSFTFKVNDGIDDSNIATINILIDFVNDPPIAHNKDIIIDEDQYIYIKLIATDPENDTLTYHLFNHPAFGTVDIINDTALYTPNQHYNGPDSFTYKVNDGELNSNTATIMITINSIYDRPEANDQYISTTEDMPLDITLTGFSPENKNLTFRITDMPVHGELSKTPPYLTYTPNLHFYGVDSFSFIVNDTISDSLPGNISMTVNRSETYLLTLLGTGYGSIKVNSISVLFPWENHYLADQEICIEALPVSDWQFMNWSGDLDSSDNPACYIMDQNKTISANIDIQKFRLNISGTEPIKINNETHYLPYSNVYQIHSHILLETQSERFKCWEGDIQNGDNPFEFNITKNTSINARFYPVPNWKTVLKVKRQVDTTDVRQTTEIAIGTAPQAYTKISSNFPENYSCDIVIYNSLFEMLSEDIQFENQDEHKWIIGVDPHGTIGNPLI
ncbi:MAG: hypothetical protein OMM_12631, partial [Candidatus Magnetoglobus multicellularis str. Araruama]